ncbi:MAG: nucleotidyltransferase family protein [Cyanobacteria bacterium]|nr:nucleotidyltransferase family protein [Cyanobacteria bacterium CG_2015-16_32_12]NCO77043.1 nucleotidyltransferase family protein [Cyanobacteria bacterium CG_2015-22_32_23]NCQ03697.1 nucleotidyltransferase family protein [Cyanobacteria bacterium CG_2015-09_32_10]NCQ43177.1 nucleotidyltransferase family protein [Cyanobacteria bacterium CG_2015-04_32_10]
MINTLTQQNQILDKNKVLKVIKAQENLFNKYHIKTLALFGSTARNEATENSDLDFLVEFNTSPTFDNYMDLKFYLEELFNKPIDLVIKQDLKPIIREEVMKEAVYVS